MKRFVVLTLLLCDVCFGHTTITVNPGGGADQTSLSAAEAALPDPLTDDYIISCSGSTADTTAAVINVVTLNGATQHSLTIQGNWTGGVYDATKYHLAMAAAGTTNLTITSNYVELKNVQVVGYGSTTYSHDGISLGNTTSVVIHDCLIKDFVHVGYEGIAMLLSNGTGNLLYNNVIYNCERGIHINGSKATVYNNTVSGCNLSGIRVVKSASLVFVGKNNLIANTTTDNADWCVRGTGGTYTTSKNYTQDANSPDAGCASATITFEAAGNYHLDETMSGTLLGDNLSGTFTIDIDGDTRSSWYAGFDELPVTITTSESLNPGLNIGLNEGLQ